VVLAVALIAGSACAGTIKPEPGVSGVTPFPFEEWDGLLKTYVDDKGRVDYGKLKSNAADLKKLEHVFASVAASSPATAPDKYPTKSAKEAYYLDAYNVCVWKFVLAHFPKMKNVDNEKASFFYFTKFSIGGKEMNLVDLEKDEIRKQFKDGRVHFALNCASGGCPQLPPEAFTPAKLEEQLNRETRKFVAEKRNVDFDPATKKLRLSHLFDWYKEDFGKADDKVVSWINNFRVEKLPTDAKLDYVDYDWTLNDVNILKR
jgi:hypothetical protein